MAGPQSALAGIVLIVDQGPGSVYYKATNDASLKRWSSKRLEHSVDHSELIEKNLQDTLLSEKNQGVEWHIYDMLPLLPFI